jgi:chromosome segregation and condensation protein ScpB
MQPIAAKTVAIVRHVDTATTAIKEMADRGLIACGYINRVLHWHVTQALLDQFDLVSTEELRDETVFQETFPLVPAQNMAF